MLLSVSAFIFVIAAAWLIFPARAAAEGIVADIIERLFKVQGIVETVCRRDMTRRLKNHGRRRRPFFLHAKKVLIDFFRHLKYQADYGIMVL